MQPFTLFEALAVPLPLSNVDTDMIIPKQYLKTIARTGLGRGLFAEMRFDDAGQPRADFVLNRQRYQGAGILVAGANFGCGSSREHAPWALLDYGFRAVIAPSFADIFYNNCFKNGILPVVLSPEPIESLWAMIERHEGLAIRVDLPAQRVVAGGRSFDFEVDAFRKRCLLEGLDDIGLTMEFAPQLDAYEGRLSAERPWL